MHKNANLQAYFQFYAAKVYSAYISIAICHFVGFIGRWYDCWKFTGTVLGFGNDAYTHWPSGQSPYPTRSFTNHPFFKYPCQLSGILYSRPYFSRVVDPKPLQWLGFNRVMLPKQLLLVGLIGFTGLIMSGALGELNQNIPLPAKWLAKAKELEASYKQSMMAMITMKTVWDYLLAMLVMAAAPAFFEEILFRGGFQQILIGWTKNAFLGILITSILFSAIHFSFFGFLPRTALGLILGFVFYYSRNIWMNIAMHFMYNGLIVTQLYFAGLKGKSVEKTMDENMPLWLGVFAISAVLVLMQMFRKESSLALSLVSNNQPATHATVEENF